MAPPAMGRHLYVVLGTSTKAMVILRLGKPRSARGDGKNGAQRARAIAGYRTNHQRRRRYSQGVRRHPASLNIENLEPHTFTHVCGS
jgi:hypothetical protein